MPNHSDSAPEKDKVLDLLGDPKKPSRRERQRTKEAEIAPTPPPSKLAKAKSEALDLFSE